MSRARIADAEVEGGSDNCRNGRKELSRQAIRYVAVGVAATAIHYGVYLALLCVMRAPWAYSIGYVVSLCVNFLLTSAFTFRRKPSVRRAVGFVGSHAVNYGLHIVLLWLVLRLGVGEQWAPLPVMCVVVPVNFLLLRRVFRP